MTRYCDLWLFDLEQSFFGFGHFHNFRSLQFLDLSARYLKLILHRHNYELAYVFRVQLVGCLLHPALYAEVCLGD